MLNQIVSYDHRRNLFIGKDIEDAIVFAVEHWIHTAKRAIQQRGRFAVALSGGSTPKAIYQKLSLVRDLDWSKVFLFWSDERAFPPEHPDSNYKMAMEFFQKVPIPLHQIFRMKAESEMDKHAKEYEELIRRHLDSHLFDLVMLGVGEDGHTASLFPNTEALNSKNRLVVGNFLSHLKTHRMTFTFDCINQSREIALYALGPQKQDIIPKVLQAAVISHYPTSRIGTPEHKALFVLDQSSSKLLKIP